MSRLHHFHDAFASLCTVKPLAAGTRGLNRNRIADEPAPFWSSRRVWEERYSQELWIASLVCDDSRARRGIVRALT